MVAKQWRSKLELEPPEASVYVCAPKAEESIFYQVASCPVVWPQAPGRGRSAVSPDVQLQSLPGAGGDLPVL